MSHKEKVALILFVFVGVLAAAGLFVSSNDLSVLNPSGQVGARESHLIIITILLMLVVVIPVYILTFYIVWKYREDNTKAEYKPDWDHDRRLESAWWAIPGVIILILSVITWNSSHQLDPFKPLSSSLKPVNIQAIALQWKWLFIYPDQGVASLNFLQLPVATPVNFKITADAPMNSLWIPKLGGQIYAMSGMSTNLHLQADAPGDYYGSSANISGAGFANMNFIARAGSASDFEQWLSQLKQSPQSLSQASYNKLAKPGTASVNYYALADKNLYEQVVNKYLGPPLLDNHANSEAH
jgi:cytochrome o ubiquinol oxidase subunit II